MDRQNDTIYDRILEDIRAGYIIDEDEYKPIKTKDAFNDNDLELESNINEYKYLACWLFKWSLSLFGKPNHWFKGNN